MRGSTSETLISECGSLVYGVILLMTACSLGTAWAGEIHEAARSGDVVKVRALLSAKPQVVHERDDDGGTPLHAAVAAWQSAKDISELLVAGGADVNAKDNEGGTPLHTAAAMGRPEILGLLLGKKAKIDAKDVKGWTPLYFAIAFKHKDVATLLLDKGADVNASTKDNWTLLCEAAWIDATEGKKELATVLLTRGAKQNVLSATILGERDLLAGMLKARPGLANVKTSKGMRPLHYAVDLLWKDIVSLLLDSRAEVNAQDEDGNTSMHYAVVARGAGQQEIIEMLLAHKANINARNKEGATPLGIILSLGKIVSLPNENGIANFLRQHGGRE